MIHIKNYQALNKLVKPYNDTFRLHLYSLIGKSVTVYTNTGGAAGNGLSGVLYDVSPNSIKLVISMPTAPKAFSCKCKKSRNRPGTYAVVKIKNIVAVAYHYV